MALPTSPSQSRRYITDADTTDRHRLHSSTSTSMKTDRNATCMKDDEGVEVKNGIAAIATSSLLVSSFLLRRIHLTIKTLTRA